MSELIHFTPERVLSITGGLRSGAAYQAEFYLSGTTTAVTVYQDEDLTTPHAVPVLADANGVFPAVFTDGDSLIKAVIKTNTGATYSTVDPCVRSLLDSSAASGITFTPTDEILATDVQSAIERVQENFETELGTGVGFLTRGTADGPLRTRVISGDGTSIMVTNGAGDASFPTIATVKATEAQAQAGSNANATMTPLGAEQHMLANALGWGQTWQDVTGSRAIGATYTNLTGRPILINVNVITADGDLALIVDGVTVSLLQFTETNRYTGSTIVPAGKTYGASGTAALQFWTELR